MLENNQQDKSCDLVAAPNIPFPQVSTGQKADQVRENGERKNLAEVFQKNEQNSNSESGGNDPKQGTQLSKYQKFRLKKSGKYILSIYEEAQNYLKDNQLDIAKLQEHDLWQQLSSDERKKLIKSTSQKKWYDEKKNCPPLHSLNSPQSKLNISKEQQNTMSNIQVNRNELISKELCASQNIENQVAVMLKHNRQNHSAIFDFLKSLQYEPFENFFEVLIMVIQAIPNCSQQVRLLVGLCGLYNGQKVSPSVDLCCLTLKYLANEDGVTSQQAIGFLKFAFVTSGDLHNAELFDLLLFDKRHKECFIGFKQWLQWTYHPPSDLALVLPNSCYILGLPFAKMLKTKSCALIEQVPSEFLQVFVQILVFSFEKEKAPFKSFLKMAQHGFLDLIEKIMTTQLLNLFNALNQEIKAHTKQWYQNISNSTRLIEGALNMVKEGKLNVFSVDICQNLLLDSSNIDQYLSAPSIIKKQSIQENEGQFRLFLKLNEENSKAKLFIERLDFSQKLPLKILNIFAVLQVVPHFIQELAMQILWQKHRQNHAQDHIFLNIAPGLGKTKLILVHAAYLAKQTLMPVIILNANKTLSDRDFEQARIPLEKLSISCASVISQGAMITFATTQELVEQNNQLPQSYHIVLDEYQNIFFNQAIFSILDFLKKATTFTGFSGSPINPIQLKLLEYSFNDKALVFQLTAPTNIESHETIICQTQAQHIKELSRISQKFRFEVPQVFILDTSTTTAFIKGKKKLPYVALIDQKPEIVNNTLQELFNVPRDDGAYGTYIINEEMGTGTDFKTSADIEARGGLVLIYGTKITNTSTFEQLSCRVGRIFNKSRRFYIIQDQNYTGSNQCYIKFQLKIAQQQEDKDSRELLCKLKNKFPLCKEDTYNVLNVIHDDNKDQDEDVHKTKATDTSKKVQTLSKINIKEECKYCENSHEEGYICKAIVEKSQLERAAKDVNAPQMNQEQSLSSDAVQQLNITNENTEQQVEQIIQKPNQNHAAEEDEKHKDLLDAVMKDEDNAASEQQNHIPQVVLPEKQKDLLKKRFATTNTNQLEQQIKEKIVKVATNKTTKNLEKQVNEEVKTGRRTQRQEDMVLSNTNKGKHNLYKGTIDDGYFAGYSNHDIHKEMLDDKIRCDKYREAIEKIVKDKSVLDVGSGTGVLSGYAVDAKAANVIAVDKAIVQDFMGKELRKEQIEKIQFINESIENLVMENPSRIPQRVDVIVSEWMGYFLLNENMVQSVLIARQNFLKAGGIMIPSQTSMFLTIANVDRKSKLFEGTVQTKHLKGVKQVFVQCCPPECLLAVKSHAQILTMDFTSNEQRNPLESLDDHHFEIEAAKEGTVNAFVGWFDATLCPEVILSTSPEEQGTHWKQSIFFLSKPIKVQAGEIIEGTIYFGTPKDNHRSMVVDISCKIKGQKGKYKESFTFE